MEFASVEVAENKRSTTYKRCQSLMAGQEEIEFLPAVFHQHSSGCRQKSIVQEKEIPVPRSTELYGGLHNSGKRKKSQTEAKAENAGQRKWIQQKSNLAASGDTQQPVGIFSTTGFHLMHFCQYNYEWHAVISACQAGCHVTVSRQRAHGKHGNQS